MKTYKLYQIDAFTKEKFNGNPAGVITNADGLSDEMMQAIAYELNNPNTAFIFSAQNNTHDVYLRFFTPTMEESICGHATIAAHYARALEKKLGSTSVRQKTGVGILPVDINKIGNDYRIVMTQGKIQFGSIIQDGLKEDIYRSLNICQHDIHENFPLQVVSTGNGKLIVGLRNNEKLHVLQPDMDKVTKISTELDVSGFYVFTMHNDDPLIHGRMFAPAYGVNEDPATGNANSALGAYLVHHNLVSYNNNAFYFQAVQGEAINRKGTIYVEVIVKNGEPEEVKISGYANIVFQADIILYYYIDGQ